MTGRRNSRRSSPQPTAPRRNGRLTPDLEHVPGSVCARVLGLSERQFWRLRADGVLPEPVADGGFDLAGVVQAFVVYRVAAADGPADDETIAAARRRFWSARAGREELAEARERRELVPLEDAKAVTTEAFRVYAGELDAMASRLASELAGIDDAATIRRLILAEERAARASGCKRLEGLGGAPPAPADAPEEDHADA